jgi:1-aminocyclopropane-1-carboxylate deaminase
MQHIFDKTPHTPLSQLITPETSKADIKLFIKRDDLIHPQVSGNKWRKLKYNLQEARLQNKKRILTFGGAFSNHIYSLAAAGKICDFETIGIIRGEETFPLNPTLIFAKECGMQLYYINREKYRDKDKPEFIEELKSQYGNCYIVPEGGSNTLALPGVAELLTEIEIPYDVICTPIGTGGTMAGLISGIQNDATVLGFASLKGENYLENEIQQLLKDTSAIHSKNWEVIHQYHFGGYAKINCELAHFIRNFEQQYQIPLDPVYTSKMLFGILDLCSKGYFEKGKTIIALHTGGLQGLAGMDNKINKLINAPN